MNQLKTKIQNLKSIIKDLQSLENHPETETISQLLEIIADLFEAVDQRLKALERK